MKQRKPFGSTVPIFNERSKFESSKHRKLNLSYFRYHEKLLSHFK